MKVTHESITEHYKMVVENYGTGQVTQEAQMMFSFSIQHLHLMVDLVSVLEARREDREEILENLISQSLLV